MENLNEIERRVDRFVRSRMKRLGTLVERKVNDPRAARGVRHSHRDIVLLLLAGLMGGQKTLRDVERLSQRLNLGQRRDGISDGCLSAILERYDEHAFDALQVQTVRDARRRGELTHPGLGCHWGAVDGKYTTLNHDCGGLGQRFEQDGGVYWRVGCLRAVLISSPGRQVLGQRVMPRADVAKAGATKVKFTGEITNLAPFIRWLRKSYGDLVSNFTLDAGLWSKAIFLAMDEAGYGVLCGLKENKPDLFREVERVLCIERRKRPPDAQSRWETCSRGQMRRRFWSTTALNNYNGWKNLRQVMVMEQTTRSHDGSETVEFRYFVTNATTGRLGPARLVRLIRQHWGIENDCNWSFDMQFGEDDGRWCTTNKALVVLAVLRMISYNLLQHLRKSHLAEQHQRAAPSPRPWRQTFELIHDSLRRNAAILVAESRSRTSQAASAGYLSSS